jgi:hypothetical protein
MASALGFGVDRRAVELMEGAETEAAQLAREVCAVTALVSGAQAKVLVQLEERRLLGQQAAVRGVGAEYGVHAARGVAGGQDQAQLRSGPEAVRNQLAAEQGDPHGMGQDEWRCHIHWCSGLLYDRIDDAFGDLDHGFTDPRAAAIELAARDALVPVADLEQGRHTVVVDVFELSFGRDRRIG